AAEKLQLALEYTLAIPRVERRLRLFCLWPLFMALLTLRRLRATARQVLTPAKVKISRQSVLLVAGLTRLIFCSDGLLGSWFRWLVRRLPQVSPDLASAMARTRDKRYHPSL